MQKTDSKQKPMNAQRKVSSSTTLNRKYVRRPASSVDTMVRVNRSPKIHRFDEDVAPLTSDYTQEQVVQAAQNFAQESPEVPVIRSTVVNVHPVQASANQRLRAKKAQMSGQSTVTRASARQLKEQAIQKALAETVASDGTEMTAKKKKEKKLSKVHFGFGRVLLALSCAAVAVFAIAYFVNINMPDISLKVAAMQTGINASYPSYVPRDYSIASITSEDKKITLVFKNQTNDDSYTIVEETSSWDSNALLNNYVVPTYGDKYTAIREQGLTLYTNNNEATWVNGGVIYKLTTNNSELSGKQIRAIAASL